MKQLGDGRIVVPIYDTEKKEIVWVAPGVAKARLEYSNRNKERFNSTIRGKYGRYLPASEAPQPEVKEEVKEAAPEAEEKKPTRRRTRKTNTNK